MERKQAEIRVEELRNLLDEANIKYYVENAPVLSDFDFDMLLKELEALEKEYPDLVTPDSLHKRSEAIFLHPERKSHLQRNSSSILTVIRCCH